MAFGGALPVSYNGYSFSDRMETLGISAKPHYDQSGRTVSHIVYSVTLRDIITGSLSTCDTELLNIRRRLLKPGQAFAYGSTGFGGLSINVTNASKDVMWGPKPQELSYKSLGVKSAEIVWKVDVAIPECSSAVYAGAFMEFNYRLAFDIDKAGYTTRTYRGYYVVAMTRQLNGSRALNDSADAYWENVIPAIPQGFQRTVQSRELDESKSRMEFIVIDTEMGYNILPVGVVNCNASHNLESAARGLASWVGVISAEYECARDFPAERCFEHFTALVKQRTDYSNRKSIAFKDGDGQQTKGFILPTKFSFREPSIYGRPLASFSLQYMFAQPVTNIIQSAGVWLPTAANDWNTWKASLGNSALHPRGNAKLNFKPTDDLIIDLCLSRSSVLIGTPSQLVSTRQNKLLRSVAGPCPSLADSWIAYNISFEAESTDHVLVHKPLPTVSAGQAQFAAMFPNSGIAQQLASMAKVPSDIVQRRTTNQDVIYVVGWALRACYDIPAPALKSIQGRPAIVANRQGKEYFKTGILGDYGHTLIWAKWRQRYILPTATGDTPMSFPVLKAAGTPTQPRELKGSGSPASTAILLNTNGLPA